MFWGEGPILVVFFKATKMVLMYSQGGESVSKIISKASLLVLKCYGFVI